MKKLLTAILCLSLLVGCSVQPQKPSDGKAHPSVNGRLQVVDGHLADAKGEPVMLRGISSNGVSVSHMFATQATYDDIANVIGANVFRLALYTWGVGSVGYCSGGPRDTLMEDVVNGVEYARNSDMYAIIDWHILEDGNPNNYIEDAKEFFDEVSRKFKDHDNVIYEICNEPNKCSWADIRKYAEVIIPIIRNNDPKALIIVGTPSWSQDVDQAADDPLPFDNILYTLHFYSATHKQPLRDKAQYAIDKGLPLFVTEFGITASSGGFPIDEQEGNLWIDFLEANGISYVMWNFSRATEPCAALNRDALKFSGFTLEDFSQSGKWLIETINKRSGN